VRWTGKRKVVHAAWAPRHALLAEARRFDWSFSSCLPTGWAAVSLSGRTSHHRCRRRSMARETDPSFGSTTTGTPTRRPFEPRRFPRVRRRSSHSGRGPSRWLRTKIGPGRNGHVAGSGGLLPARWPSWRGADEAGPDIGPQEHERRFGDGLEETTHVLVRPGSASGSVREPRPCAWRARRREGHGEASSDAGFAVRSRRGNRSAAADRPRAPAAVQMFEQRGGFARGHPVK